MPSASVAPPSASATVAPSRKLPVPHRGRAFVASVSSRRPPHCRRRSRPRGSNASAEESGVVSETTTVTSPPDDALKSARAATVVVAPHARTRLPFMRSSRRGSGVVVSLDGAGGDLRVLTAAHVACLAGPNNRVDVRASASFADARTRVGSVVAVHPRLDLALIKLDDLPDALDPSETDEPFPSTFAPLAAAPPPVGARVAALGYAMGWSSAFRTAMRRRAGDSAAGVWGHLLATHEEAFFDFGEDEHDEEDSGAPKIAEFVLHTASVASGCSGGPLVSEAGEVIGVHSFGDAFYGGARDVAVATPRRVVESLGGYGSKTKRKKKKPPKPASPETYATATVLAAIFASSDPALAAMCPELTPEQRKAWIL